MSASKPVILISKLPSFARGLFPSTSNSYLNSSAASVAAISPAASRAISMILTEDVELSSDDELSEDELSEDELSEEELSEDELSEDELSEEELSEDELSEDELSEDELSEEELSEVEVTTASRVEIGTTTV